jgi:hypothetical protein
MGQASLARMCLGRPTLPRTGLGHARLPFRWMGCPGLRLEHSRQAGGWLEIDQVRIDAEAIDRQLPKLAWVYVALDVGYERQVLLAAQQDECARTAERLGVRKVQAGSWHGQQVAARRIPRVGGVDHVRKCQAAFRVARSVSIPDRSAVRTAARRRV